MPLENLLNAGFQAPRILFFSTALQKPIARIQKSVCNAVDQLQRCKVQFIHLGASPVCSRFAALPGAAVHQTVALCAQTLHGKWRASAVPQQPLQCCTVVCFDAAPRIHRYTTSREYPTQAPVSTRICAGMAPLPMDAIRASVAEFIGYASACGAIAHGLARAGLRHL